MHEALRQPVALVFQFSIVRIEEGEGVRNLD
jgi:hypothetical protein